MKTLTFLNWWGQVSIQHVPLNYIEGSTVAYEDILFGVKEVLVWERETKNKILVNISYGHSSERAGEEIKFNRFKHIKK